MQNLSIERVKGGHSDGAFSVINRKYFVAFEHVHDVDRRLWGGCSPDRCLNLQTDQGESLFLCSGA